MSDAYLGEIKLFSGNYAPEGWCICDGSSLSIASYNALYSLLGTTYGGDGVTNFNLPDLRGRVPVGQGQGSGLGNRVLGEKNGSEQVSLSATHLPVHSHTWQVSTGNGSTNTPAANVMLAKPTGTTNAYSLYRAPSESGLTTVAGPDDMITPAGASTNTSHNNMMPSLALNYIICVTNGIFPQRN